jgi:hypothetical protein
VTEAEYFVHYLEYGSYGLVGRLNEKLSKAEEEAFKQSLPSFSHIQTMIRLGAKLSLKGLVCRSHEWIKTLNHYQRNPPDWIDSYVQPLRDANISLDYNRALAGLFDTEESRAFVPEDVRETIISHSDGFQAVYKPYLSLTRKICHRTSCNKDGTSDVSADEDDTSDVSADEGDTSDVSADEDDTNDASGNEDDTNDASGDEDDTNDASGPTDDTKNESGPEVSVDGDETKADREKDTSDED